MAVRSVWERWGHAESSGSKLRPLQGSVAQGFLTDGGRWPWERRKAKAKWGHRKDGGAGNRSKDTGGEDTGGQERR